MPLTRGELIPQQQSICRSPALPNQSPSRSLMPALQLRSSQVSPLGISFSINKTENNIHLKTVANKTKILITKQETSLLYQRPQHSENHCLKAHPRPRVDRPRPRPLWDLLHFQVHLGMAYLNVILIMPYTSSIVGGEFLLPVLSMSPAIFRMDS